MTGERPPELSGSYDSRRILRNFRAAVAGEATSKGAAFLATIVVARTLSSADFGRFVFILALVSIALLLSDVGLQVACTRAIAADRIRANQYVTAALAIGGGSSVLCYCVIVAAAAAGVFPHGVAAPLALMATILFPAAVINAYWSLLRGHERQDLVYLAYSVSSLVLLVGVIAVGRSGATVTTITAVYVGAYALRLVVTVAAVRTGIGALRWRIDRRVVRAIAVSAPATALAYLLQSFYSHVDIVLLGFLVAAQDIGFYAAAYRLVDAIMLLTAGAMTAAVFPVFSRLAREAPDAIVPLYDRVIRLMTVGLVPGALLVLGLANPVITLVYGHEMDPAAPLLALLAPSIVLIPLNFMTTFLALAIGRVRDAIASAGLAAAVNIALNLALVPPFGVKAAAISTLGAEIVMLVTFQVLLGRGGFASATLRTTAAAGVIAVVPCALVLAAPQAQFAIGLAGAAFAVVGLRVVGVLRPNDARAIKSLISL